MIIVIIVDMVVKLIVKHMKGSMEYMTEKRFYTDGKNVMQKGEVWVVAGGEHSADVIATALNELIEERNKLQFDYNMEVLTRQSIEKENEQLKQELESCKQVYQTLKSRHGLLHDECLEAECDRDSFKKDVISLENENEQLKQELESFEQVNFTDMCDGTRTVWYIKKENVGDENE